MREVYPNVFQGDDTDVEKFLNLFPDGWIIHAAKEPWHRNAVGYVGKSAPADDPEYLYAVRKNRMFLNMVDAHDPKYINKEMVDRALHYALRAVDFGWPLLIHCNQGKSRSVMLCALLEPWFGDALHPLTLSTMNRGCAEFYRDNYWGYVDMANNEEKP